MKASSGDSHRARPFILYVAMSTVIVTADLPICNSTSCAQCLDTNTANESFQLFATHDHLRISYVDGTEYRPAFRVARCVEYWDSHAIYGQIVGILVAERMGLRVEYVNCDDAAQCYMAASGCAGWLEWECRLPASAADGAAFAKAATENGEKVYDDPLPDIFFIPEVTEPEISREGYVDTDLGNSWDDRPSRSLGLAGFTGQDGLFTYADIVEKAWNSSTLALDHYKAYTTEAGVIIKLGYLDPPMKLMDAGIVPEEQRCEAESSDSVIANTMANLRALNWTCIDSWWLTPACISFGDSWVHECIVVLDDDWGYDKPELYEALAMKGMPIAKLTAGYYTHAKLVRDPEHAFNVAFTWWQPDASFGAVRPVRIAMDAEFESPHAIIIKVGYLGAMEANMYLSHLLQSVSIDQFQMKSLMSMMADAYQHGGVPGPEFLQWIACHWLRSNERVWTGWMPKTLSCLNAYFWDAPKQRCTPCPPGTHGSKTPGGESYCKTCPPGRFAENRANAICRACSEGLFMSHVGASACDRCPLGRFQFHRAATSCFSCSECECKDDPWAEECKDCVRGVNSTTLYLGAAKVHDCVCPVGTYFQRVRRKCITCADIEGLTCPGGHAPSSPEPDTTPLILQGFMVMSDAPLEPYTCITEKRCPEERSAFNSSSMCGLGFADSPRCSYCKTDYYEAPSGFCEPCDDNHGAVVVGLKLGLIAVSQVTLTFYLYIRHNSPNPAGAITINLFIAYVQQVHILLQLSLDWPSHVRFLRELVQHLFTVYGLLALLDIKLPCYAIEDRDMQRFLVNVLSPLSLFAPFSVMSIVGRLIRRPLKKDFVLNTIGMMFKAVFISVARFSLLAFLTERMPNGKILVRNLPSIELASERWWQVMPISIVACFVYVVGFLVYVAYAVWVAPRWASSWPGFMNRYRFLFGGTRPDKWWWVCIPFIYQLGLVAIQATSVTIQRQVYLSICLCILILMLQFRNQPFKFIWNNIVDGFLKCSVLIFVVMGTSYFDIKSRQEHDPDTYGWIALCAIGLGGLVAVYHILFFFTFWLCTPLADGQQKAIMALRFRDTTMKIALLPDKQILKAIGTLGETDLKHLDAALRSLVATFLRLQPSPSWHMQRIMPGVPFKVWDPQEVTREMMTSVLNGNLQEIESANMLARLEVMALVQCLRSHLVDATSSSSSTVRSAEVIPRRSLTDSGLLWSRAGSSLMRASSSLMFRSDTAIRRAVLKVVKADREEASRRMGHLLKLDSSKDLLTFEEFVDRVQPLSRGLRESQLRRVFDVMDYDGAGSINLREFITVIMSESHDVEAHATDDKWVQRWIDQCISSGFPYEAREAQLSLTQVVDTDKGMVPDAVGKLSL